MLSAKELVKINLGKIISLFRGGGYCEYGNPHRMGGLACLELQVPRDGEIWKGCPVKTVSTPGLVVRSGRSSSAFGNELLRRCVQMLARYRVDGVPRRGVIGLRRAPALSLSESDQAAQGVILKFPGRAELSLPLLWGIGDNPAGGLRMPIFYSVAGQLQPDIFGLNQKLRLTERPRVLYLGTYRDGAGLSMFLDAIRKVLGGQGEAVLIDGAAHREQLAPVVAHLHLGGQIVFAPPLSQEELAGLYQSADLLVYSEQQSERLYGLLDVFANGLPVILADTLKARPMVGYPTLLVDPDQPEIWADALREGLENGRLREKLIGRGLDYTAPHLMPDVVNAWREAIERLSGAELLENTRE